MRGLLCIALLCPAPALADDEAFEEDLIVFHECVAASETAAACIGVFEMLCSTRPGNEAAQSDPIHCVLEELRVWEVIYQAELRTLYDATVVFDTQTDANVTADFSVFKTIQTGEFAWQDYRVAHCKSETIPEFYAPVYEANNAKCHAKLTAARIDWLRDHPVYGFG